MKARARVKRLGAAVAVLLVLVLPLAADAAVLKKGSKGDEVVTLQKKLKQWGYYNGAVDGIFGSGTEKAVQYFQRKNGLAADGVVGTKTEPVWQRFHSPGRRCLGPQRASVGRLHLWREPRRTLHRPGGRGRGDPEPGQVQQVSQLHRRRRLPVDIL